MFSHKRLEISRKYSEATSESKLELYAKNIFYHDLAVVLYNNIQFYIIIYIYLLLFYDWI